MLATLTLPGTFWFYSGVAFAGSVLLYFFLPETEGRTLLDIEEHFLGKRLLSDDRPRSRAQSIASRRQNNANGNNNNNNNKRTNGFDMVVKPPPPLTIKNQATNGTQANGQTDVVTIRNGNDAPESIGNRLSIPEIMIIHPNAGSKRYKKSTCESRRNSCHSFNSEPEVQDTHL